MCELSHCFTQIYSVNDDDDVTFVVGPSFFSFAAGGSGCLQWFLRRSMHPLLHRLATSHASIKIAPQ